MTLETRVARLEAAEPESDVEWVVLFHDDPIPPGAGPIIQLEWPDDLHEQVAETPES